MPNFDPYEAILVVTQFIILLTFHEWGHAKSADMLGDPTARDLGRMSLNPGVHIDVIGTLILPPARHAFRGWFLRLGKTGAGQPVQPEKSEKGHDAYRGCGSLYEYRPHFRDFGCN